LQQLMPKPKAIPVTAPQYECFFCKKEFKREGTFLKHLCEKKRRFTDRELPHVRLGYLAYQKFYKFNYRREINIDHFNNSQYYNAFVKFGKYMIDVNAIDPMEFIQFLIEKGASIPVDRWATDAVYETYVRMRTMKESPETAAERTILLMQQWAIESGNDYKDFFRLIPTPLAVHWIRSGRISPWMLYATQSGQELLGRLDNEQVAIVSQYIDPAIWTKRIKLFEKEINSLAKILEEVGI
jgi:hypothetical protein